MDHGPVTPIQFQLILVPVGIGQFKFQYMI